MRHDCTRRGHRTRVLLAAVPCVVTTRGCQASERARLVLHLCPLRSAARGVAAIANVVGTPKGAPGTVTHCYTLLHTVTHYDAPPVCYRSARSRPRWGGTWHGAATFRRCGGSAQFPVGGGQADPATRVPSARAPKPTKPRDLSPFWLAWLPPVVRNGIVTGSSPGRGRRRRP